MIGAVLTAAALVGPVLHRALGGMAWLALILTCAALAFLALRASDRVAPTRGLLIILGAAALMRIPLLLEAPYLSSDIYRYIWDGRVQAAGINPYLHVPTAPAVAHLRDQAIYPNINRADYAPSIYQPAAQMIFWLITRFGDSVLAMKLGLLACEALAIAGMIAVLRQLNMTPTRVVAYAWHPLPVWEIAGSGHVDACLVGLVMAALWLYLRGRTLSAGVIVSAAVLIKPTALLVMPVLWRPWNWKLPAILAGVVAILYLPYLSAGWKVFGFLHGYVVEEELNSGGGFRYLGLLQRLTGPITGGVGLYLFVAGAIMVGLALQTGLRTDRSPAAAIRCLGMLTIAFLVLLTPHYPWYYLALAPFLAFGGWGTPWVLTTGAFLLYDVIDGDRMPPFELRDAVLHLTALAAVAYDTSATR